MEVPCQCQNKQDWLFLAVTVFWMSPQRKRLRAHFYSVGDNKTNQDPLNIGFGAFNGSDNDGDCGEFAVFSVLDMLDFKFVGSWYNIHNIQYFIEKT